METSAQKHYAAVIADLETKRAEIDRMIESLRAFAGVTATKGLPIPAPVDRNFSITAYDNPTSKGSFEGMSIADAAIEALRRKGSPAGNADIVELLTDGGVQIKSDQPLNVVGSILNRRYKDTGDIKRVGRGVWALPEWVQDEYGRDDYPDSGIDFPPTKQPPAPPKKIPPTPPSPPAPPRHETKYDEETEKLLGD